MNDPNAHRPGYKQTEVGWIPREWDLVLLAQITRRDRPIVYGIVQGGPDTPGGVPYIRSTDVGAPFISEAHLLRTTREIAHQYRRAAVEAGDVVFSLRGNIGATSCVPKSLAGANLSQGTARISLGTLAKPQFTRHVLAAFPVRRLIDAWAKGSTFREITIDDLRKVPVPLPPLPEQHKIASILSTCDDAIERTRELIAAKREQKKGLMQQLLTGKRRLRGFGENWIWHRAQNLFERVSIRSNGDEPVLSVTQDEGVVMRSQVGKRIQFEEENLNTYKLVRPNDYVISLRSFQGGLEMSGLIGRVSPAYHVIRARVSTCPDFYKFFFKSREFIARMDIAVIGIRDGKQVSYEDFSYMRIPYPSIAEQRAIASVLTAADAEIGALERKLGALREQKRGLMQQLLTGAIRVGVGR